MNINQEIRQHLEKRKAESIADFLQIKNVHPLFVEIFSELKHINHEEVKKQFTDELITNCRDYWMSDEDGYDPNEKVKVLLFEYDNYRAKDAMAMAYGIVGEGFRIELMSYDFGYDYDFTSSMESNYGVTLTTLSPLAKLGDDIPKEYEKVDFYGEKGFRDLNDAYLYTTYLILHDAISDFVKNESFQALSKEPILHIMIGEHDCGNEQPLWYFYENEDVLKKAIEEQGESD